MRRVSAAQSELLRDSIVPGDRAVEDEVSFPSRPAIPPVLACALGVWAGCAAALLFARSLSVVVCAALCAGELVACICCLCLIWRRRTHLLALVLVAGLLCGGVLGFAQGARLHHAQQVAIGSQGLLRITALSDGMQGEFGVSCTARVQAEGSNQSFTAKISFPRDCNLPMYGQRFTGYGTISELSGDRAPRGWQRGIVANVKLRTCERVELRGPGAALLSFRERAVRALTEPLRGDMGLAAAISCGWRFAGVGIPAIPGQRACACGCGLRCASLHRSSAHGLDTWRVARSQADFGSCSNHVARGLPGAYCYAGFRHSSYAYGTSWNDVVDGSTPGLVVIRAWVLHRCYDRP